MILFFDFERLLYGQTIGDIWPAARLAKVLMPYPQVDLVLTRWRIGAMRWRIGAMRSVDDVRGEVPELGELGERINDVAHRPVRSDEQPEREITGTLRRSRQLYWAAVVPVGDTQGYIEQATRSGAPLILCPSGFDDEAAQRLQAALARVVCTEELVSGVRRPLRHSQKEALPC
jgi:phosphoglycolate phosphatase-like HAD superfamily hydrolase